MLGPARLPAPGAAAARRRDRDRRATRRRGARRRTTTCSRSRASATTPPRRSRPSPSGDGTSCSTPTCAGSWPAPSAGVEFPARLGHPRRAGAGRRPAARRRADGRDWSVAVMELGALVCTAANPRCGDCPVADLCAWRRGRPPGLRRPAAARSRPGPAPTGSAGAGSWPCCATADGPVHRSPARRGLGGGAQRGAAAWPRSSRTGSAWPRCRTPSHCPEMAKSAPTDPRTGAVGAD